VADPFATVAVGWSDPASNAVASCDSDTVDLAIPARALYVGTGGNVKVTTKGGQTVTFASVPDGSILPVACTRVFTTGTTAPTTIIALH
jgi:hypothetical protein